MEANLSSCKVARTNLITKGYRVLRDFKGLAVLTAFRKSEKTKNRKKKTLHFKQTKKAQAISTHPHMGLLISKLFKYFLGKEDVRILMVGLDGAGKTTILYKMKFGEVVTTTPTIGFNVETVEYNTLSFTVWDIGGQQRIRNLWHHYFANTAAVIFVVDAADAERLCEAADELHAMLDRPELCDAVLLVIANKQDLPQALSVAKIVKRLNLDSIKQDWHVHGNCATRGNGLYDGLEYLCEMLNKRKK